jgi:hypothetical protein
MYQSINFSSFCDAFRSLDRNEQFTYNAKRALFDYLEDMESQTGQPVELDVVAICCEYSESTFDEIRRDYMLGDRSDEDVAEWINEHSPAYVGLVDGSLVFAQF